MKKLINFSVPGTQYPDSGVRFRVIYAVMRDRFPLCAFSIPPLPDVCFTACFDLVMNFTYSLAKKLWWYYTIVRCSGRGSVRIECTVRVREVGGSNPPAPTEKAVSITVFLFK